MGKDNKLQIQKIPYELGRVSNDSKEFFGVVRKLDIRKLVNESNLQNKQRPLSLQKLRKVNEKATVGEVALILAKLNNFYGDKNAMHEDMIWEVSEMILDAYPFYNMYDIGLCCHMGKLGKFGKVYGSLNGGVVMGWFSEYEILRMTAILDRNDEERAKHQWSIGDRVSGSLKDIFRKK